ncbi:hypothetical protein PGTUg99_017967 [Puccinia graminis f. sp. tritici]|uniref:Uncharacterized protein n=1 Tax=Puccinia graminis f. sp. tritici TaxID=56615 RepID=A0A5B0SDC8_PUCGR|nr:hypothetical protein PGTUg99_017967 [Puccinia graminis f. sp. tritici]
MRGINIIDRSPNVDYPLPAILRAPSVDSIPGKPMVGVAVIAYLLKVTQKQITNQHLENRSASKESPASNLA